MGNRQSKAQYQPIPDNAAAQKPHRRPCAAPCSSPKDLRRLASNSTSAENWEFFHSSDPSPETATSPGQIEDSGKPTGMDEKQQTAAEPESDQYKEGMSDMTAKLKSVCAAMVEAYTAPSRYSTGIGARAHRVKEICL